MEVDITEFRVYFDSISYTVEVEIPRGGIGIKQKPMIGQRVFESPLDKSWNPQHSSMASKRSTLY